IPGKSGTTSRAASLALGMGGMPDKNGAALFVQAMRGQMPEGMQASRTRATPYSGNNYGTIPIGAQYSLNTIITVGALSESAFTSGEINVPAQPLYLYGTHAVAAFRTQGAQGAGFQVVLFTDGFIHCTPPAIRTGTVNGDGGIYTAWAWYPVGVINSLTAQS